MVLLAMIHDHQSVYQRRRQKYILINSRGLLTTVEEMGSY